MTSEEMDIRQALFRKIEHCVETDPGNRSEDGSPYFDAPLVGFASADDDRRDKVKQPEGGPVPLQEMGPYEALR